MQKIATHPVKSLTNTRIVATLLSMAWAAIILWLSLTPSPPDIPGVLGWDKLLHAGAYGLLALLVALLFSSCCRNSWRTYFLTGFICLLYGGLVEILQMHANTGRTAEWWDLFADAIGVAAACVVFRQGYRIYIAHANRNERIDGR